MGVWYFDTVEECKKRSVGGGRLGAGGGPGAVSATRLLRVSLHPALWTTSHIQQNESTVYEVKTFSLFLRQHTAIVFRFGVHRPLSVVLSRQTTAPWSSTNINTIILFQFWKCIFIFYSYLNVRCCWHWKNWIHLISTNFHLKLIVWN